jgi:hypothetical protein
VISVLRDYAARARLPCSSEDKLPFVCGRLPIKVWAVQSERGVVVCYAAEGVSFESKKFGRQMDALQGLLAERFGSGSVVPSHDRCPSLLALKP